MGTRLYAYLVSIVVMGAVAWPLTWKRGEDSFPLSSYPMFARAREDATIEVQYAVGVTADGQRRSIEPALLGTREVLQARSMIATAVAQGASATKALCQRIAEAAATAGSPLVEIRIVTGTHDAIAYLTGRDRAGAERIHGLCRVPR